MKSKIIILGSFLVVGAVIVNAGRDRRPSGYSAAASGPDAPVPTIPAPSGPVELTVLYSPEKQDWLEAVAIEFRRLEPGIKLKLQSMESLQAAEAIAASRERPAVWMPSDTASLELMRAGWRRQHADSGDPVATDADVAPQPVVLSPLVFVIWRDRSDALSDKHPLP
jgi:ABC-type glycerol-3-phosphate transport system substrate-binding protein